MAKRRAHRTWTPAHALALVAGVVATVLAWPPIAIPGLGLAMLAPIAAAIDDTPPRRAFALVYLYSVAMALVAVRWLIDALAGEYGAPLATSWLFLALVVAALALVPAAAGALHAALRPRLSDTAAPIAFAALWTLGEWLRGEVLGVPWLLVGQTFARAPLALQPAALGGVYAVGFVATAIGAGVGVALRRARAAPLAAPAALAAAALAFGAWRLATLPGPSHGRVRVGVVQAAVPQAERFRPGSASRNVARHAAATRALARRERLDLVVWSETAVDVDIDENPPLRLALERLADEIGVPIVTGAPRSAAGRRRNAVVLFVPGRGLVESYAKQRLVPFSEYDPDWFAFLAPLLGPVTEGEPYVPGGEPTVFEAGPIPFATPICFEITYPALVQRFREAGALLLVNLSNDAWFGRTGYPEMHLAHAVVRAVETGSWVVRGANTGISAAIDPAGRIVAELPVFEEGSFVAEVTPAGRPPLYGRAGDAPLLAALGAALAGCAAAGRRARPRRLPVPAVRRAREPR